MWYATSSLIILICFKKEQIFFPQGTYHELFGLIACLIQIQCCPVGMCKNSTASTPSADFWNETTPTKRSTVWRIKIGWLRAYIQSLVKLSLKPSKITSNNTIRERQHLRVKDRRNTSCRVNKMICVRPSNPFKRGRVNKRAQETTRTHSQFPEPFFLRPGQSVTFTAHALLHCTPSSQGENGSRDFNMSVREACPASLSAGVKMLETTSLLNTGRLAVPAVKKKRKE